MVGKSRGLALLALLVLAPTGCELIAGTKNRKVGAAGISGSDAGPSTGGAVGIDAGPGTGGFIGTDGSVARGDGPLGGEDIGTGGVATGGMVGTGGKVGTGGVAGSGGVTATGGVVGTGGVAGTGGAIATGGTLGADAGPDLLGDAPLTRDDLGTRDQAGTGGVVAAGGNASGGMTGTSGTSASGGTGTGGAGGAGGTTGAPPSCDGVPATCGPNLDQNCCASTPIPGGNFNRSNDPSYPATISGYRLDTYEITVGRFRKFVAAYPAAQPAAGSGKNPNNPADGGWDASWNSSLPGTKAALASAVQCPGNTWNAGDDTLPMNCITWFEAEAFCIWDGGRLPTALEWDYAASGGAEERYYPWSVPPSEQTVDQSYAVYATSAPAMVGSRSPKGDAKWGQADMAGNLHEWVQDLGGPPYSPGPCNDCANLTAGGDRNIRGGSYPDEAIQLRASMPIGNHAPPSTRPGNYGARCARSVAAPSVDGGQGGSGGTNNVVGQARIGIFRAGVWYLDSNDNLTWETGVDAQFSYGAATDIPVTGDWTGDGRMRVGVFRDGYWTFDENGNGILESSDATATFGGAGDRPVTGAWTGTGRTLIGVYRNGDWYLDWDGDRAWNAAVDKHYTLGGTGYLPCTGDWTGNGTTRIGLLQGVAPNNAFFTLDIDGNGAWTNGVDVSVSYGLRYDIPVPGQWGTTKRSQIGIFRDGEWDLDVDGDYVWNAANDRAILFGGAGDTPVVFVRP